MHFCNMRQDTYPENVASFNAVNNRFGISCSGGGTTSRGVHTYDSIISLGNIVHAWQTFSRDKKKNTDVRMFQIHLMDKLYELRSDLKNNVYKHGSYTHFKIDDPKPRDIHKSSVRDRVVHHLLYTALYPYFDRKFIYDSYSCRLGKGTHRALDRFTQFVGKVSRNHTQTCWVLKCDIRKFFASIDHEILKDILSKHIEDKQLRILLENIVDSFHTVSKPTTGLPLGNLTSQLLVNVYMNEFDQYVKHILKVKYYIRYADDFVIVSEDRSYVENLVPVLAEFLEQKLKLTLHPDKLFIKTVASGVDFLGWVHFPKYRVLRGATKRRMLRNIGKDSKKETISSYRGMLSHGNAYNLERLLVEGK